MSAPNSIDWNPVITALLFRLMLADNLCDGIFVTAKINPRLDELLNIFVDFGGYRLDLIVGHTIAPFLSQFQNPDHRQPRGFGPLKSCLLHRHHAKYFSPRA